LTIQIFEMAPPRGKNGRLLIVTIEEGGATVGSPTSPTVHGGQMEQLPDQQDQ
jgi:hypothetical protein